MASLAALPPGVPPVGRHGRATGTAGARLRIVQQRQIVSVIARRGCLDALRSAMRTQFGLDLPETPRLARGRSSSILWCGHQQWFVMADEGAGDLFATLRECAGASAALSDQSDSRLIVELSGPAARAVLAKLAPVDLDPRVFSAGATALTLLEHVGGQITQIGDEPAYELMAFRSFAESLLHGILTAGAEFGIDATGKI